MRFNLVEALRRARPTWATSRLLLLSAIGAAVITGYSIHRRHTHTAKPAATQVVVVQPKDVEKPKATVKKHVAHKHVRHVPKRKLKRTRRVCDANGWCWTYF